MEIELILILEVCLLFKLVDHIHFLMVVLGTLLVVLFLLQNAQMGAGLWLRPFSVFALGQSVLEC